MRQASLEIRLRLAGNVKRLRHGRGLTQLTLAAAFSRSQNFVSWIERAQRNVTLSTLAHLAKGLQCCESSLLENVSTVAPPPRLSDLRESLSAPGHSPRHCDIDWRRT